MSGEQELNPAAERESKLYLSIYSARDQAQVGWYILKVFAEGVPTAPTVIFQY